MPVSADRREAFPLDADLAHKADENRDLAEVGRHPLGGPFYLA